MDREYHNDLKNHVQRRHIPRYAFGKNSITATLPILKKRLLQLIGIALFAWILSSVDLRTLLSTIFRIDMRVIVSVLLLQIAIIFVKSLRWHALLSAHDTSLTYFDCWKMYNIGFFLSLATPGKLGEFGKVVYLHDRGISKAEAFGLVIVDRIADVAFIFLVSIASMAILFDSSIAIASLAVGMTLVATCWLLRIRIKTRLGFLKTLNVRKLLTTSRVLLTMLITVLGWMTYYLWAGTIAFGLGIDVPPLVLVAVFTITGLVSLLPVAPSGLGTRDAALIVLLAPYGIEATEAVSLALIMFASPIIISVIGALYFMNERLRNNATIKHGDWTLKDVADHWDNSPEYDNQNAKIDSYFRRFEDSAPLFEIPENARVLDIDCRTGNGTCFFQERFPTARFTCVASSPTFKERCETRMRECDVNANVYVFERLEQPFDDETFDVILTYETLEHVPWPDLYVKELSRMLKPGGTLVLTTPNVLWEPVHWLSATLHIDHGEGPHRMVPRREILASLDRADLDIAIERSFVIVPAGPRWLLNFGKTLERLLPETLLRMICLRRTFVCRKRDKWWTKLKTETVDTKLETQCGTAVGVSEGTLTYEEIDGVPTLVRTAKAAAVPKVAYEACPGRYCDYPTLNRFTFGRLPDNWLSGVVERSFTGHASDETVRRNGASGGVITQTLIHLLETERITGAVCLKMGADVPWRAKPIVARTREDILACSQSIYSVTPVNTILSELSEHDGPLAYVGLPDQVAGIRKLQMLNHPSVKNIEYVLGPYQGTQMYFEAIRSFLRSHGVRSEEDIVDLKYRAGEWPGYLQIALKDGRTLKAEKFYYNYLIPFFVTRSSLQLVDFTNELTDISVGDAWSPAFEKDRKGHSVVLARTSKATELLTEMRDKNIVSLEDIDLTEALDMHGHMLDFKKRGSFIRNDWHDHRPKYGYRPTHIPRSRIMVERCLRMFFGVGKTSIARWTVEHLPLSIVGPCFNRLRKTWKGASKPTKRKGLRDMEFTLSSET